MRTLLLAFSFVLAAASGATAAERPRFVQLDLGWTEIHRASDRGPSTAVHVGRALGRSRVFAVDAGLNAAFADEGFASAVVGLELWPFPRSTVTPFLRVETGILAEEFGAYLVLGGGGGLAFRLSDRLNLRVGVMTSDHGWNEGGGGPKVAQFGLEYRW